jgi:hypothetical protein
MYFSGWAMKENEDGLKAQVKTWYAKAYQYKQYIKIQKIPHYGHTGFVAIVAPECPVTLEPEEILAYADDGNLCFGGHCIATAHNKFGGSYNVD